MKRFMILGAVLALAVARPEVYKEKEDFQFSRSSSDDGTKSGFYGAQRGNAGGNYERAHNMDSLAQNQMSGLVRQVEGELGDGARMRTGSVYTAANSRGTYGSGHYDLSNLSGRNFQEGTSFGDSRSQSQSSLTAGSAYNAASAYNTAYGRSQSSRHNGYQATGQGVNLQSDNLQTLDHTQGQPTGQYDYGRQTSHAAGYNAQSGFQQHSSYDTSNTNLHSDGYGSNVHTRLISATPVRIIVRPGTRVTIPVAAQSYDLTHGSSLIDQNSLNSEAEVLGTDNQRTVYTRPSNAKHYESSYNYRKQWEKHDTIPATVILPTSSSIGQNSELLEDGQARAASEQYDTHRVSSQRAQSAYGGYNANVKSTTGQSGFNYDTQHNAASLTNGNAYSAAQYGTNHHASSLDSSSNGYNIQSQYNTGRHHGVSAGALTQATAHNTGVNAAADLNSQVESLDTKPKSYHSAYSYHKSWERQGDPYVIKPASGAYYDGQSSQRLTTGSSQNQGYLASGSHYQHSHASGADCDENGHIRVARSYNTDQFQDTQQQSQNLEDMGQQQQSQNLEDFGQQQQSQNLEDFSQQQQSQNLQDFGQQQQSQNLEDFGQQQQSQNLEDFSQQQQSQNLEDFGQQQQSQSLDDFGQQQSQNLDYFGQHQQDLGQQTQDHWGSEQNAGQQTQNTWDNLDNLSQQSHKKWDEDLVQKPQVYYQSSFNIEQSNQNDHGQHTQDTETQLKNNSQAQDKWDFKNQDDKKNVSTLEKEHEQSNKFYQQQTQFQLSDVNNSFQQSQQHNTDFLSVWNQFDSGTDQHVQQNKHNREHSNSNDNQVNWSFVSQQAGQDLPLNPGQNPHKPQLIHTNVNDGLIAGPTTVITQQSPATDEQSNTGYFNTNNGQFNIHTNQNQFWNDNSFQETHRLHQLMNTFTHNHRREQNMSTHSFSHVNTFDTIAPNPAPLSSVWDKLGNFEQTLSASDVNKGDAFSQVQTNTQTSYQNSMHAHNNMESTLQENHNNQVKPTNDLIHVIGTNISHNKSDDAKTEKESSLDVGRGDISPEDLSESKPDTPDIPVSSETISVKNNTIAQNFNQDGQHHESTHGLNNFQQHHNFEMQKDTENTEQQTLHVFSLHENIVPPNPQDSEKQHNVEHHNVQDFDESSEQQNLQVSDLDIPELGKQDNLEQQSSQGFGHQANVAQQNIHDFEKQENLEQQSSPDFAHQINVEQQNLHDFGKSDNMEQQSSQDFWHQVNVEQQNLHDFGKQDNLEQQSSQDFAHQVNVEQQYLHDFGKQDNLEQQSSQDFAQQVNVEQQNLNDFGKLDNLEQQSSQDFAHPVNVEQQNLHDFDKQDNLEQQSSQDFGQQENLEQQNIQDFGQHENLDQHNLQDFGQQAYLDQHSLQYGSLDNMQQQNKNLEQLTQEPEQSPEYSKEERTALHGTHLPTPEVIEQPIAKKHNIDLQSISTPTTVTEVSPVEPVTESAGFWKSVGNKLSRAKSKIASWF